ncbi:MAG: ABC transporter substrate-binding protein [Oligoflexia bacterium]|nr:ABC transporter substrate-binding protein [Oligoflexia bacterium]
MSETITIHHSPDADDAFMFYGIVNGAVSAEGLVIKHALNDIESLNQKALRGELDFTAVSVHGFAHLSEQFAILKAGASMGGAEYGPRLIALTKLDLGAGKRLRIALPGVLTSATLAFQIYLKQQGLDADLVQLHFEEIMGAIKAGEVDAGVIIHEGQITHQRDGFVCILDLGKWWWGRHQLPLPLGVNVVKKKFGAETMTKFSQLMRRTIEYSLEHRDAALEYALSYGRGLSHQDADVFVGMYVNEWTLDLGEKGQRSIRLFLKEGYECGLLPRIVEPQFV